MTTELSSSELALPEISGGKDTDRHPVWRLARAELRKILKRRFSWILLGVLLGSVALLSLASGLATLETEGLYETAFAFILGMVWYPILLTVIPLGGDMKAGALAASMTRIPTRGFHVMVRWGLYSLTSWVDLTAALGIWFLIARITNPDLAFIAIPRLLAMLGVLLLFSMSNVAVGILAVGITRSSGPAIGAAIGFTVVENLFGIWSIYRPISIGLNMQTLVARINSQEQDMTDFGYFPSETEAVIKICLWVVFMLGVSWSMFRMRDIE